MNSKCAHTSHWGRSGAGCVCEAFWLCVYLGICYRVRGHPALPRIFGFFVITASSCAGSESLSAASTRVGSGSLTLAQGLPWVSPVRHTGALCCHELRDTAQPAQPHTALLILGQLACLQ